jgi:DNA topoisomerase-1
MNLTLNPTLNPTINPTINLIKKQLNRSNREYIFNSNYVRYISREASYDIRNYSDGITRKDSNYYYISNNELVSSTDLDRINKLNIPSKWNNVWVSRDSKSNIQVVGIDDKGRKQYKYNEIHIKEAEKNKFLKLIDFINALTILDKNLEKHQQLQDYDKNKVISTMLILVKKLHIRVGKEQYAKHNKSYGIASLRKEHVKIDGDKVMFNFKGKSHQRLNYVIEDKQIKNHFESLLKLQGDRLFKFYDKHASIKKLAYTDLNHYMHKYMGKDFSIKDFRTYAANKHFIETLIDETKKQNPTNPKQIKKNLLNSLRITAHYLRHTESISKKSYVMNFCIELYRTNPEYFIKNQDKDTDDILLDLLKMYKHQLKN